MTRKKKPLKLTPKEGEVVLNILKENYHWLKTLSNKKYLCSGMEDDYIGILYEEITRLYKRYRPRDASFKVYLNTYIKYILRRIYYKNYNIIKIPEYAIKEHKNDVKSIVYAIPGYRYYENGDKKELDFLYGYDEIDCSNFEATKLIKDIKHISLNVLKLPRNYKVFYLHNVKGITYRDIQKKYFPEITHMRVKQLNDILVKSLKPRLKELGYSL